MLGIPRQTLVCLGLGQRGASAAVLVPQDLMGTWAVSTVQECAAQFQYSCVGKSARVLAVRMWVLVASRTVLVRRAGTYPSGERE